MKGINNKIYIGVGNVSTEYELGAYYQDISPAIVHIQKGIFAGLDDYRIPYCNVGKTKKYSPITVIQYALMNYDLYLKHNFEQKHLDIFFNCVSWLESRLEPFKDAMVIKNMHDIQYNLSDGWISGMVQGQAISVFLRAFQVMNNQKYLDIAENIYKSFSYNVEEGGFRRFDNENCIWFEEYPTQQPSYVLNGFIYTMFGILDLYRVTKKTEVIELWNLCINTLEKNLHKYDLFYWSVYDQLKRQLVSYYYQKNVHIPLMKIMYLLTNKQIFDHYASKWENNIYNPFHRMITQIMYRVKPRINRINK